MSSGVECVRWSGIGSGDSCESNSCGQCCFEDGRCFLEESERLRWGIVIFIFRVRDCKSDVRSFKKMSTERRDRILGVDYPF